MPNSDKSSFEFSARSRQAAWQALQQQSNQPLSVLILGGGIVGAGIFREFVLHDVPDVVLVEKSDFASGTSHASSKLIHAGIRYLEQAWDHFKAFRWGLAWENFCFVLKASNERKVLGRLAPALIKPKPIYVVVGKNDGRLPLSVWLGAWFYYLIQLCQGQFFSPPSVYLRKTSIERLSPFLDASQVKAIFSFWDSETDDARLVLETIRWGAQNGGTALNYVQALSYKKENDVWRVRLRNQETKEETDVLAKVVVNATGAFVDEVRKKIDGSDSAPLIDRVAGSHLDVYPALTDRSFYITAGDGRLIFILKRNEDGLIYTRIGTTERPLKEGESSETPAPTEQEIAYLKQQVKEFFPQSQLNDETILRADAGIRPLTAQPNQSAFSKSREHRILEEKGFFHIVGVKLTDYRRVAVELFNQINWSHYGVHNIQKRGRASALTPLREEDESGAMYSEATSEDWLRQGMILYWTDYVDRRHGLWPRYLRKTNPGELKKRYERFAAQLNWDKDEFMI